MVRARRSHANDIPDRRAPLARSPAAIARADPLQDAGVAERLRMVATPSTDSASGIQVGEGAGIECQRRARRTGLSPEAQSSLACRGRAL